MSEVVNSMDNKEQAFLRRWINSELKERELPECTDKEFRSVETGFFYFYRKELNHIALARQKALFDLLEKRGKECQTNNL